jgi:hypothetical protein
MITIWITSATAQNEFNDQRDQICAGYRGTSLWGECTRAVAHDCQDETLSRPQCDQWEQQWEATTGTMPPWLPATNQPPIAIDDNYQTGVNQTLNVPVPGVLYNDISPRDEPLVASLGSSTSYGTLVLNADGSFVYTPGRDFTGTDQFTYYAADNLYSNYANVDITVGTP